MKIWLRLMSAMVVVAALTGCRYNYDESQGKTQENQPYQDAVKDRAFHSLKADARTAAAIEKDSGAELETVLADLEALKPRVDGVVYASLIEAVIADGKVSDDNLATSVSTVVAMLNAAAANDTAAVANDVRPDAAGDAARDAMQNYVDDRSTESIKAMQDSYYAAIEPAEETLAATAAVSAAVLFAGSAQATDGPDSIDATKEALAKAGETIVGDDETETQKTGVQLLALVVEKTTATLAAAEAKGLDEQAQQATIVSTANVVNSAGDGMAQVAVVVAQQVTDTMISESNDSATTSAVSAELAATLSQKKIMTMREAVRIARQNSVKLSGQLAILNKLISLVKFPKEVSSLKRYIGTLEQRIESAGQNAEAITDELTSTVAAIKDAVGNNSSNAGSGTDGSSTASSTDASSDSDQGTSTATDAGEQTDADGKITKAVTPTAVTAPSVTERLAETSCPYQRSTPTGDASGNAAHLADVISNSPDDDCSSSKNAVDDSVSSRWSSDRNKPEISESTPAWIMVKLAASTAITSVLTAMDSSAGSFGFKYDYRVLISPDGTSWELVSSEKDRAGIIEFTFSSRQVKYIVIEVSKSSDSGQANIHQIKASGTYTAPSGSADAGANGVQEIRDGKIMKTSTPSSVTAASVADRLASTSCGYQTSTPSGDANGNVAHFADVVSNSPPSDCASAKMAVDNSANSRWSSDRNNPSTSVTTPAWIMVKLGASTAISRVLTAMDSSSSGFGFKYDYRVLISADGTSWELVSSEANRAGHVEFSFNSRSVQYIVVEVTKSSDTRQANVHQIEAYAE
jgi:hypothetical protein